ncbi:MAG: hypothetical protein J5949_05085 [Oscillospiraceae bacterium]|nr:hypothetical protein [Oscillospiraceae bacterium]
MQEKAGIRRRLMRIAMLVLCAAMLSGCAVPVTREGLLTAALGPAATAFFAGSSPQVQADTAGAVLPCYYDASSGTYYYVCEDLNKVSAVEYAYTLRAFYFQNGMLRTRTLATRTVLFQASGQSVTACRDYAGNSITETAYNAYADRYFSNCAKVTFAPGSGTATQVTAAPTATPIPTPAPTPAPSQNFSGPVPVITKNPTSESMTTGGTTWFIAHARNAERIEWKGVSPDGFVYTVREMLAIHPGLALEEQANDTLCVRNVPTSLNGWGFQARFEGKGGVAVSSTAYIYVKDYIGAYQSVLNAYRMAYQAGGHTAQYAMANGLSPMIAHSGHVGYAFKDLDKDGTPELFIAGLNTDEAAKSSVYDVYTLIGGVPTRLAVSSEQDCFYLCTDNTLFNIASAGTGTAHYFTYRFRNNRLGAVDGYKSCPTDNARVKYYYQTGAYTPEVQKTDVPITENEFGTRVFERVNTVFQLLYTQLA